MTLRKIIALPAVEHHSCDITLITRQSLDTQITWADAKSSTQCGDVGIDINVQTLTMEAGLPIHSCLYVVTHMLGSRVT